MKIKMLLAMAVVSVVSAFAGSSANAQDQISLYVWHVERSATHIGSGYTYTQTYGPFYSYQDALNKKQELDAVRSYGTYGYGVATIERSLNPIFRDMSRAYYLSPYQQMQLYWMFGD